MPTYWDRFARTYTNIGEAEFWLKHRRRITEGLSGRVLEVCCGGGRLVLELLKVGIDAYGMDLSPQMAAQAQATLAQAGWDPAHIVRADVTRLPFPDAAFDAVLSTGAIGLFRRAMQETAMQELARVTRREVRLLEPFEKRKGLYGGRILAFLFDGMRPIPPDLFAICNLDCREVWDLMGGAFSSIYCVKGQPGGE